MRKIKAYHRKDNRWEARIKFDGKTKSFYGATKETAEQKAWEFLCERKSSPMPADTAKKSLTADGFYMAELSGDWLGSKISRTKESTRAVYRMKLDKHIIPFFGDMKCGDISAKDIYVFINKKLGEGLSSGYVSDILIVLKAIFRYGSIHCGLKNPAEGITVPKTSGAKPEMLNREQQLKLKSFLFAHLTITSVCILTALELGLRIGEICGLKWSDIDFENALVHVNRTVQRLSAGSAPGKTKVTVSDPKSVTSKRSIPVPAWFMDILGNFRSDKDNYILSDAGKPVEPRTLQYRFSAILKKAGLPPVNFHSLRHAFATNAVKLGFDTKALSEILGHSSVEITLNRYVHPDIEVKRGYMERMTASA